MASITCTTGTWHTTAASSTATGTTATTNADDVTIPNGVTVTIAGGVAVVCRSLTIASGGTLIFGLHTSAVSVGGSTAGPSNVALSVSSGATITLYNNGGILGFAGTYTTTPQTIDTGGKSFGTFNHTGSGKTTLASAVTVISSFNHTGGTLDTNGYAVNCATFNCNGSATRTLTLGSSTITAGGNVTFTSTNLTLTAHTATITMTGSSTIFTTSANQNLGGLTLNCTMSGQVRLVSSFTLTNFTRTGSAAKTDTLILDGNNSNMTLTVTGTFTCNGNSATNRVLINPFTSAIGYVSASPLVATINAATASISNTDFMDITCTGEGTWSGTSVGDCGGNTGLTPTTPTTRYAVAAGSWSSTAVWSSTSTSGSTGASVPLPQDSVIFDGSSGAGTYTMDMPRACKDLTMTGFTRTLAFSSTTTAIYGSLILGSGMTISGINFFELRGRDSHTITSNGKVMTTPVQLIATGGTYTLADAMSISFNSGDAFTHRDGTFNTAGYTVTLAGSGYITGGSRTRSLVGSTSTFSLTGTSGLVWNISSTTNLTCSMSSSTIAIATTGTLNRSFAGGGLTYGTLTYNVNGSTGSLTISGSNSFSNIVFADTTNARTLILTSSTTTTIRGASLGIQGTSGKLMSINSSSAGTAATISMASGVANCAYLSVKDSTATGGAKFYAVNSTDVSGNTGWVFSSPHMQHAMMQFMPLAI